MPLKLGESSMFSPVGPTNHNFLIVNQAISADAIIQAGGQFLIGRHPQNCLTISAAQFGHPPLQELGLRVSSGNRCPRA